MTEQEWLACTARKNSALLRAQTALPTIGRYV